MKSSLVCETRQLVLPDQILHYRLYRHPQNTSGRRLLLLHGAGVAGRDTWEMLISELHAWYEVLVPDQRGAGESVFPDGQEHPFSVHELVQDAQALVDHCGWWQFDLGGYSLGGLISLLLKQRLGDRVGKQFLLEAALLDRIDLSETLALRERYAQAAGHLRAQDQEAGIRQFLDTISPNRRTSIQTDQVAVSRLGRRPLGFAHALEAVNQAVRHLDREAVIAAQGDVSSFIGSQSVDAMHALHRALAACLPNWHYFLVAGTDHSLPFQKPRQIARTMNAEMQRFLS
ncbi:alpha/beta fold hydrolase [Nitrincola tapanii]|uniref:Alpha/beta fold hydrolase n=1 Tax=Nitrincola tapanii TaxID=1708751 RepID=A0A5A9W5Z7_9GAMM|nr:alpha/beta hydrolase [Nitrincola tapanii]KAA0875874.1 alpha/beta fold hydrolase [Nitrincola tapanii]